MINVVGAVLLDNNHIILAKRASNLKNFPNLYEFPGGKIEYNETPKRALSRELQEELNIKVKLEDICDFENNNIKKNIDLTLFIIKNWDGEITIKENIHSQLVYVKIKNLKYFNDMIPSDKFLVDSIVKHLMPF